MADDEGVDQGSDQCERDQEEAGEPIDHEEEALETAAKDGLTGEQHEECGGQETQAEQAPGSSGHIQHGTRVKGRVKGPKRKSDWLQGVVDLVASRLR